MGHGEHYPKPDIYMLAEKRERRRTDPEVADVGRIFRFIPVPLRRHLRDINLQGK
jgi:hypothetical protein